MRLLAVRCRQRTTRNLAAKCAARVFIKQLRQLLRVRSQQSCRRAHRTHRPPKDPPARLPASGSAPSQRGPATAVVISSGGEGDRAAGSLEVKVPDGWETGRIRIGGRANWQAVANVRTVEALKWFPPRETDLRDSWECRAAVLAGLSPAGTTASLAARHLRFPGDPSCAFAPFQDPGRTDSPSPIAVLSVLPLLLRRQRLQRHGYIEANARLRHLLSTLQGRCCHRHMRDLLPAGWVAFAGRELNPLDATKGFRAATSLPPFLNLS